MPDFEALRLLHHAKNVYLIVLRDKHGRFGLAPDPGLNRPWSSKNKRYADDIATQRGKETGLEAAAMSIDDIMRNEKIRQQFRMEIGLTQPSS
jgi:hypothetical protein